MDGRNGMDEWKDRGPEWNLRNHYWFLTQWIRRVLPSSQNLAYQNIIIGMEVPRFCKTNTD